MNRMRGTSLAGSEGNYHMQIQQDQANMSESMSGKYQWCGSGSRGIKWREKHSLTNSFFVFFSQEIIFFKSEPKKVANL